MSDGKNIRVIVDKDIAEHASENAKRSGATLIGAVTRFITDLATKPSPVKDKDAFIQEIDVVNLDWCASRGTLYTMREQGELKEKVHYEIRDTYVFYKFEKLREFFKKNYPNIEEANLRKKDPFGDDSAR